MIDTALAPRLLCCHKQSTSARTRFVRWPHGMLAFEPPPAGATLQKSALAASSSP
ncbi:MAG: hypothetical protein HXY29_02620 [Rhodocyclaceae bacterium]|nr:hypothetical protein [Rhodocyclaceae bacterium]